MNYQEGFSCCQQLLIFYDLYYKSHLKPFAIKIYRIVHDAIYFRLHNTLIRLSIVIVFFRKELCTCDLSSLLQVFLQHRLFFSCKLLFKKLGSLLFLTFFSCLHLSFLFNIAITRSKQFIFFITLLLSFCKGSNSSDCCFLP
jgi:hypothetical protein